MVVDARRPRAFLISPEQQDRRIRDAIRCVLDDAGVDYHLEDNFELPPGSDWASTINQEINRSDFFIVDISGHDPNVMYEIGLAHGLRKPTILITNDVNAASPLVLADFFQLIYDARDLDRFEKNLRRQVFQYVSREDR